MNWTTFFKEFGFPVALAVYLIFQSQAIQERQAQDVKELQTEVRTELKELVIKALVVIEKNTDVLSKWQKNNP